MSNWTRRKFFFTTLAGGLAASARGLLGATIPGRLATLPAAEIEEPQARSGVSRPLIISAANGVTHLDDGMAVLRSGGDPLDAVLAVVTKEIGRAHV